MHQNEQENDNLDQSEIGTEIKGSVFSELDSKRKISVIFLLVSGLFFFVYWVVDFTGNEKQPGNSLAPNLADISVQQEEEDLRQKDTDGDGLNDWEEINVYNTSPYLEDTDSDGFGDQEEIVSKNDPNCAAGQACSISGPDANVVNTEDFIADQVVDAVPVDTTVNIDQGATAQLQSLLQGQGDASSLREMLIGAGMDKEILDQLSDEELMVAYKEILEQ